MYVVRDDGSSRLPDGKHSKAAQVGFEPVSPTFSADVMITEIPRSSMCRGGSQYDIEAGS